MFETLVDRIEKHAADRPHDILYRFLDNELNVKEQLTYRQLVTDCRRLAVLLQKLPPGSRVLIVFQPGLEYVLGFLACLYAGVTAVPVYPPRFKRMLDHVDLIAKNADARAMLTTASLHQQILKNDLGDSPLTRCKSIYIEWARSQSAITWERPEYRGDDVAFLQYTSGSTGAPKGVMITHANIMHNSGSIQQKFGSSQGSRGLIWLPPYHDMGLIGGIMQPAFAGFPVDLMSPFTFLQKPVNWLEALSRYRGTISGGPNFAYQLLVDKVRDSQLDGLDLSSWDLVFCGAEPIRGGTAERFNERFAGCGLRRTAFYPCYGMAETTLIATGGEKGGGAKIVGVDRDHLEQGRLTRSDDEHASRLVGCGSACADLTVKIVDPQSPRELPDGRIGEIWLKGPSIARGYWQDPELSRDTFNNHLDDGDGPYLRSGDLGALQDGELYITGRIKDLIIIRGQNHYPQDIEETVGAAHPALRPGQGAAVSLDRDDTELLVVVHEVERTALRDFDGDEVLAAMREAVSREHGLHLHDVAFIKPGSIPRTTSGKIRRSVCREHYLDNKLNLC